MTQFSKIKPNMTFFRVFVRYLKDTAGAILLIKDYVLERRCPFPCWGFIQGPSAASISGTDTAFRNFLEKGLRSRLEIMLYPK